MRRISSFPQSKFATGFSLVELMVGLTLGLLVVGGVTAIFVSNSGTRAEIEKTSRQIENGRYAMQLLSEDLRLAGFYGEFSPVPMTDPAAKPDPCATNIADLKTALPLHVQGYDDVETAPTCIADLLAGTDILVVRRTSTCAIGETGCDAAVDGRAYFQTTLCSPNSDTPLAGLELAGPLAGRYVLDTAPITTAKFPLHKRDCNDAHRSDVRLYRTHIYFVANNNQPGDGIPTLKRAELRGSSFTIVPLVEGIENLQLEYGFPVGATDVWTPAPDSYNTCAWADCVKYWRNTYVVKVHLLARNTESSVGYQDTKRYNLGLNADGESVTAGPFNDAYRRHAYSTTVRLNNPANRAL